MASESSQLGQARATIDALLNATRTGDRLGFDRLISDRDPTFPDRARLLYANLSTLPLTRLQARVEPTQVRLAGARAQLLGSGAWAQRAVVSWRLAGDDADVEHQVWLTFLSDGGQVRLAGTVDQPPDTIPEQKPSWWLGPVTAQERGGVTVVVGSGQALDRWAKLAATALDNVQHHLPDGLRLSWSGQVVLEVPATHRDFESVLGEPSWQLRLYCGSNSSSWNRGRRDPHCYQPRSGTTPIGGAAGGAGARDGARRDPLTRFACADLGRRRPRGVGLHPSPSRPAQPKRTGDVLTRVRDHGAPRSFPSDRQFRVGEQDLQLAYAEAWLACRYIADRYSATQLGRLYAELDRGRSLDEASRSALKISDAELISSWRADLARLSQE